MKHSHLYQPNYSPCTISESPQYIPQPNLSNFPTATVSPWVPVSHTILKIYRQGRSTIFTLSILSTASCSFLILKAIILINCCVFKHSGCISLGPSSFKVAYSVIGARLIEFSSARSKLYTNGINIMPDFLFLPTPFLLLVAYCIVLSYFPEGQGYFSSNSVSTPDTLLSSKIYPCQHLEVSKCLISYSASTPSDYLLDFVSTSLLSVSYPFRLKDLWLFFDIFQLHHYLLCSSSYFHEEWLFPIDIEQSDRPFPSHFPEEFLFFPFGSIFKAENWWDWYSMLLFWYLSPRSVPQPPIVN